MKKAMKKTIIASIVALIVCATPVAYACDNTDRAEVSAPAGYTYVETEVAAPDGFQNIVEIDLPAVDKVGLSEAHPSEDLGNPYRDCYDKDLDVVGVNSFGDEFLHLYAAHGWDPVGYAGFFYDSDATLNRVYIDWLGDILVWNDKERLVIPYGESALFELVNGEDLYFFTVEVGRSFVPHFDVMVQRSTQPVYFEDGTAIGGAIAQSTLFRYGF